MMQFTIEIDENQVRELIANYLSEECGIVVNTSDVHIETKSAQNYRAEWEQAKVRVMFRKTNPSMG